MITLRIQHLKGGDLPIAIHTVCTHPCNRDMFDNTAYTAPWGGTYIYHTHPCNKDMCDNSVYTLP